MIIPRILIASPPVAMLGYNIAQGAVGVKPPSALRWIGCVAPLAGAYILVFVSTYCCPLRSPISSPRLAIRGMYRETFGGNDMCYCRSTLEIENNTRFAIFVESKKAAVVAIVYESHFLFPAQYNFITTTNNDGVAGVARNDFGNIGKKFAGHGHAPVC